MVNMKWRRESAGVNRPKFMDDEFISKTVKSIVKGHKGPGSEIKLGIAPEDSHPIICNINWTSFCTGGSIGIKTRRPGDSIKFVELAAIDIHNIEKGIIRFSPYNNTHIERATKAIRILKLECGEASKGYIKDMWNGNSAPELEKVKKNKEMSTSIPIVEKIETPIIEPIKIEDTAQILEEKIDIIDSETVEIETPLKGEPVYLLEERRKARLNMKRKVIFDSLYNDFVKILQKAKDGDPINCSLGAPDVCNVNFLAFTCGSNVGIVHRGQGRWIVHKREVAAITPKNLLDGVIKFSVNNNTNRIRVERAIDILDKESGRNERNSHVIDPAKKVDLVQPSITVKVQDQDQPKNGTQVPFEVTSQNLDSKFEMEFQAICSIMNSDNAKLDLSKKIYGIRHALKILDKLGALNEDIRKNMNELLLEDMLDTQDLVTEILR